MNKKDVLNKLKSQKGLTGADVAIAISILIASAVIVTMIYINLNVENKSVSRNAGATRLATNILANIELEAYENVTSKDSKNGDGDKIYNTRVPNGYHVIVSVEENNDKDIFKMVKNVTVEVKYSVSDQEENIKVSTTIEKKYYNECNKPNLSENFLANANDNETKQISQKIFVPIKYSYVTDSYVVTNENDDGWYNYSSREWAKMLVFSDENIKKQFVSSNGSIITDVVTIDGEDKKFTDYLYVWIPNFGKAVDITLEDGEVKEGEYYFRAGNKGTAEDKNALVLTKIIDKIETTNETDGVQTVEEIILNAYEIDDSIIFQDSTGDAVVMSDEGFWRLYEETPSSGTVYESLTESRFGPMILY